MTAPLNNEDTGIQAPKAQKEYIRFDPFPSDGQQILTIVAFNTIPDYVNPFADEPNPAPYPAVEFIYGTETEAGPRFVKANPIKRSIHEKATFTAIYKAATGKLPVAGAKSADLIGKGVVARQHEARAQTFAMAFGQVGWRGFLRRRSLSHRVRRSCMVGGRGLWATG